MRSPQTKLKEQEGNFLAFSQSEFVRKSKLSIMYTQTKVNGVVLAGGLARRMGGQDKGLVDYNGRAMIEYALEALAPVVDEVFINANRHLEQYRQFGYTVISDQTETFDGPLAGVLSAMLQADAEILLVIPCDSPLIQSSHLQKILTARAKVNADIAVAFDGQRLHPVFLALKRSLASSLQEFMSSGQRKIDIWLEQHHVVRVDFSETPQIFLNVNTLEELSDLESGNSGC